MENTTERTTRPSPHADEALVGLLPGFVNGYARVNGVTLHYVAGGQGTPLVLLPGWPQTWWAYHKVMPLLAARFRVIAVDIRGMGSSEKPPGGYDKKTMAADVHALIRHLGYERVHVAGHDIGAHVAFSFAANFPEATARLVMLDTPHPDESMYRLPMLPLAEVAAEKQAGHPYPWWLAFNQVKELPEQLLAGRFRFVLDYVFKHASADESSLSPFDREVYAAAYDRAEAIRAGNAWYQAFPQDIRDGKTYGKLGMPVLGIGGSGFELLALSLPDRATHPKLVQVEGSGHFIAEEQPHQTARLMIDFLDETQMPL
ncbi:MAG: Hydrolase, alpha/beta fold family [uncultured Cytophagales bacterium]|uniref:Hydrolase, alpha/beta fold family n=1 Tax=uncultured Cytophagales bacterium TaxID=158755 RepID=A0A6J4HYT7_9SPHI|nr:MAG: Hydrolase, alpha/beta fold family [uncultured Cytophagales bacterium]